jgi:hypothetical protein
LTGQLSTLLNGQLSAVLSLMLLIHALKQLHLVVNIFPKLHSTIVQQMPALVSNCFHFCQQQQFSGRASCAVGQARVAIISNFFFGGGLTSAFFGRVALLNKNKKILTLSISHTPVLNYKPHYKNHITLTIGNHD